MAGYARAFLGPRTWAQSPVTPRGLVAVGASGKVITSGNGTTWTARTAINGNTFVSLAFSPTLGTGNGRFVAVSTSGDIYTSDDFGVTWSAATAAEANNFSGVTWDAANSVFIVVSQNGTHRVQTSSTGTGIWTVQTDARAGGAQLQWKAIANDGAGTVCAVAINGNSFKQSMSSADGGVTWTIGQPITETQNGEWDSVAWSPFLGEFCAPDANINLFSIVSSDGDTWTEGTSAPAFPTNSIAWSPTLNLFSVVGSYSSDGLNWTNASTIPDGYNAVCWSTIFGGFIFNRFARDDFGRCRHLG